MISFNIDICIDNQHMGPVSQVFEGKSMWSNSTWDGIERVSFWGFNVFGLTMIQPRSRGVTESDEWTSQSKNINKTREWPILAISSLFGWWRTQCRQIRLFLGFIIFSDWLVHNHSCPWIKRRSAVRWEHLIYFNQILRDEGQYSDNIMNNTMYNTMDIVPSLMIRIVLKFENLFDS